MYFWFCLVSSADDVDSNIERFPWKTSSVFSFLQLISSRKSTLYKQNERSLKTTVLKIGAQCCHNYSKLVPCKHVTWELPARSPTCQKLPRLFIVDCFPGSFHVCFSPSYLNNCGWGVLMICKNCALKLLPPFCSAKTDHCHVLCFVSQVLTGENSMWVFHNCNRRV